MALHLAENGCYGIKISPKTPCQEMEEDKLRSVLAKYGDLKELQIPNKCLAFAFFAEYEEARDCLDSLQDHREYLVKPGWPKQTTADEKNSRHVKSGAPDESKGTYRQRDKEGDTQGQDYRPKHRFSDGPKSDNSFEKNKNNFNDKAKFNFRRRNYDDSRYGNKKQYSSDASNNYRLQNNGKQKNYQTEENNTCQSEHDSLEFEENKNSPRISEENRTERGESRRGRLNHLEHCRPVRPRSEFRKDYQRNEETSNEIRPKFRYNRGRSEDSFRTTTNNNNDPDSKQRRSYGKKNDFKKKEEKFIENSNHRFKRVTNHRQPSRRGDREGSRERTRCREGLTGKSEEEENIKQNHARKNQKYDAMKSRGSAQQSSAKDATNDEIKNWSTGLQSSAADAIQAANKKIRNRSTVHQSSAKDAMLQAANKETKRRNTVKELHTEEAAKEVDKTAKGRNTIKLSPANEALKEIDKPIKDKVTIKQRTADGVMKEVQATKDGKRFSADALREIDKSTPRRYSANDALREVDKTTEDSNTIKKNSGDDALMSADKIKYHLKEQKTSYVVIFNLPGNIFEGMIYDLTKMWVEVLNIELKYGTNIFKS
uniref:RRM domain-containing protein n=1 Tax=Rhodnius prolixus TaxID=13249 RepID=T1H8K2_RHOPR